MVSLPDYGIGYVLWVGALALAAVAILQVLYFALLLIPKRGAGAVRQPNGPVMPTNPANLEGRRAAPVMSSGGKMVILSGLQNVEDIPLPNNNFLIGRYYHPENNIHVALDEKSISRRHANFQGDDKTREYYLIDTNSSYGTALRVGDKLQQLVPGAKFRIYNGDVIQFGQQISVRMVLPGDSRPVPAASSTPQPTRA